MCRGDTKRCTNRVGVSVDAGARKLQFEVFAQVLPRSRELPFFGWKLDNAKIEIIKQSQKETNRTRHSIDLITTHSFTNMSESSSTNTPDPRDPSGYLKLDAAGRPSHTTSGRELPTVVKIVGTARDDLNGLLGFCTSYNRDRERYMVTMACVDRANSPNATVMALKPSNLTQASTIETYKAQFQQLKTDPRVKQRLAEYHDYARTKCHPFKVQHVAGALVVVLAFLFYYFGFTKTVMLVSAIVMMICILVEDVLRQRRPWRDVARNFPSRSKMVIEKQFPFLEGRLSENLAAGMVGLLLAFTIQAVFFTGKNNSSSSQYTSSSPLQPPSRPGASSLPSNFGRHSRETLEELYHLGFQDSLDGKDRGHSLASKLDRLLGDASATTGMEDLEPIPEINYSATPLTRPPPPKTFGSRLFSMRTAGSAFYLYRMAMQVGVDPSSGLFSVGQLAANIQHNMPTWQKAMVAFSVYNLFSNLFL